MVFGLGIINLLNTKKFKISYKEGSKNKKFLIFIYIYIFTLYLSASIIEKW